MRTVRRSSCDLLVLAVLSTSLSFLFPAAAGAEAQWVVQDPAGQGAIALPSGGTGAAELSGITWAGGDLFYVIGDNARTLFPLQLSLDMTTGTITSATLQSGVDLSHGSDLEGVAFHASNNSVLVADEGGPALREHFLADGALVTSASLPVVFNQVRANLSLESLSVEPGGSVVWTANEEALSVDGGVASFVAGTVVRLQKLDAALQPSGQWAYVTDPIAGDILSPGRDVEVSGVVDLVALSGGGLLVLERELGSGGFRHRLYEVDFSTASDTSGLPSLDGATYTSVAKTLLWEQASGVNFEGITLGPLLANNAQSLVLISDAGGGLSQSLLALILLPSSPLCEPQPLPHCRPAVASRLAVSSAGGTRDSITWAWRKGSLSDLSAFGDPIEPIGQGLGLCLYDSSGAVPQLRLAAGVERGSRWQEVGSTVLKYADRGGTPDGVTKIKARMGSGRAEVQIRGKGQRLGVPAPALSGNLLSRDPEVTVQLVNRDTPSECFTASFIAARRETAAQFKAAY